MRNRRLQRAVLFASFIVIGFWFWRVRRPRTNPVSAIVFENRATDVNRSQIEEFSLQINGIDPFAQTVVLRRSDEVRIIGKLRPAVATPAGQIQPTRLMVVGHRPAGSPESSWKHGDVTQEWVGPATEKIDIRSIANLSSGDYDLRVYLLVHVFGEDLPTFDLLGSGRLRVDGPGTTQ
jgi:hypothetical protein